MVAPEEFACMDDGDGLVKIFHRSPKNAIVTTTTIIQTITGREFRRTDGRMCI